MIKKLKLKIPAALVNEPIIYKMVTLYEVVPNILEAKLNPHANGEVLLELNGTMDNIEKGNLYLKELNIEIIEM